LIVDALYGQIVAAARQRRLYAEWRVPDTPLGRFEMMALHIILVMRRFQREPDTPEGAAARALLQELTDVFFLELDHSLRELGIGDLSVPKRMKHLARMFYGRAETYTAAIDKGDREGLAAALARNVRPEESDWMDDALSLGDHVLNLVAALERQPASGFLEGRLDLAACSQISMNGEEA
jgi:cytochrome b pre-mRNA-processing protein 3